MTSWTVPGMHMMFSRRRSHAIKRVPGQPHPTGLSSTTKVENLWTLRLGKAYCRPIPVFIDRCGALRHVELLPSADGLTSGLPVLSMAAR